MGVPDGEIAVLRTVDEGRDGAQQLVHPRGQFSRQHQHGRCDHPS